MKYRRHAFTLIELLVVIAIIGILATIIIVSYGNVQAKSRDSKRKADLQAIASAYTLHYADTKRWYFDNSELKKVDSAATENCEGGTSNCSGWVDYITSELGYSPVSPIKALVKSGYLTQAVTNPQVPEGEKQSSTTPIHYQYMKYYCADKATELQGNPNTSTPNFGFTVHGIRLFASLETIKLGDDGFLSDTQGPGGTNDIGDIKTCNFYKSGPAWNNKMAAQVSSYGYGMNYSVVFGR